LDILSPLPITVLFFQFGDDLICSRVFYQRQQFLGILVSLYPCTLDPPPPQFPFTLPPYFCYVLSFAFMTLPLLSLCPFIVVQLPFRDPSPPVITSPFFFCGIPLFFFFSTSTRARLSLNEIPSWIPVTCKVASSASSSLFSITHLCLAHFESLCCHRPFGLRWVPSTNGIMCKTFSIPPPSVRFFLLLTPLPPPTFTPSSLCVFGTADGYPDPCSCRNGPSLV